MKKVMRKRKRQKGEELRLLRLDYANVKKIQQFADTQKYIELQRNKIASKNLKEFLKEK